MKKLVDEPNEGLVSLIGQVVTLFCANYFYTGKLVGVNEKDVLLANPGIVYETGEWNEDSWGDYKSLEIDKLYIRIDFIESYGVYNR